MLGLFLAGCSGDENPPPESEQKNEAKINAPHISQLPELERGCEVTTLAMLLQHAGEDVDKMELFEEIEKVPFEREGKRGHPSEGFVGNMETMDEPGLGVYHGPVAELAEKYLPDKIEDLTGEDFEKVLEHVADGRPVWVLVTSTFDVVPEEEWETWDTNEGKEKITYIWHSVLVTGFDEEYIYVNDPLEGKNDQLPREQFIAGWEQFGSQAITYED
ncbi:C39 family peptidase [Mesobacillus subterraneus]|uniref:C39 family peptidase n=1 Tax=Mesobacillus subterraneus TaxID=285983 RepID=UPI0026D5CAEA